MGDFLRSQARSLAIWATDSVCRESNDNKAVIREAKSTTTISANKRKVLGRPSRLTGGFNEN